MSSVKCLYWWEKQTEEACDWPLLHADTTEEEGAATKVSHHPARVPQVSDLHFQLVGVARVQRTEDEV